MALEMKETSRWWYARIVVNGKLCRFLLMERRGGKMERIEIKGTRPPSMMHPEKGDAAFLESYHRAKAAHDRLVEEGSCSNGMSKIWLRGSSRPRRGHGLISSRCKQSPRHGRGYRASASFQSSTSRLPRARCGGLQVSCTSTGRRRRTWPRSGPSTCGQSWKQKQSAAFPRAHGISA
jgi:hypothetical protein